MDIKTKPYAFHYNDGSFIVYDLIPADYERAWDTIRGGVSVVKLSLGIFITKDIRAIVEQKPVEQEPESAEPLLTADEQKWYEENKAAWENFGKEDETE